MAVLIKRYANRKLYNTESSRYITLKGISELVRDNKDIRVVDNETGKDITPIILSQILVDDQRQGSESTGAVPGRVLSELIQRSGDALYKVLRGSFEEVDDRIADVREGVKRWVSQQPGSEDISQQISLVVQDTVHKVLQVADLPTRGDLEALNKNLERLASALEAFETRSKS